MYATGYTKVYADYSTSSKVVGELGKGNALRRVGKGDGWSKIYYKCDISYVPSKYLTTEKETEATTMEDGFVMIDGFLVYEGETTTDANYNKMNYREDLAKKVYKDVLELRKTEGTWIVEKMWHPKWDDQLAEIAKKRCKGLSRIFLITQKAIFLLNLLITEKILLY